MEQKRLRLNEFKELYKAVKTGVVWLDYLLFSFVYWLEEKVIENRSQQVVDEAIKEYETLHEVPMPDMVTPVYTEKLSDTSIVRSEQATSLPEMRLTAPWYDDTYGEK